MYLSPLSASSFLILAFVAKAWLIFCQLPGEACTAMALLQNVEVIVRTEKAQYRGGDVVYGLVRFNLLLVDLVIAEVGESGCKQLRRM